MNTTANKIIVIEGPSGAGKDSVIKEIIKRYPNKFEKIVSVATRAMRKDESQGNPYLFVSDEEFDAMVKSGDIFEFTYRHGDKRGMSEQYITKILNDNKIALKDCDMVGVTALRTKFENVTTIFLIADKIEIENRLRNRGDKEKDIQERMQDYDKCIEEAKHYDYVINNTDLNKTIDKIMEIIYS